MKKIFSVLGSEKLSKDAMRQIVGANSSKAPSSPKGSASANSSLASDTCHGSKCCWNDQPENCSECVENVNVYENYCPDFDAHLAACECW